MTTPHVACLGVHILDVLGRPVTDIPPGQGRATLDEIKVTAAGTAGGTAVDLAKLGADVTSVGPIGDDSAGRMLRTLLAEHGVDPSQLAVKPGTATPSTILPIRPNGERPSLHAPGAIGTLTAADVDPHTVASAQVLHVGGPDVLGDFAVDALPDLVAFARDRGTVVTMDVLKTAVPPGFADLLGPVWPCIDFFLPNDDQLRALTGEQDLERGARSLIERGVGSVIVTTGAHGSLVVDKGQCQEVPAFNVPVVDTTGCGDAYSAGLIIGLCHGWDVTAAAHLGTAASALVAQGLGSDAGIVDLAGTLRFWKERWNDVGTAPPDRL